MALGTERATKPYVRNSTAPGTERLSVTEKVGYGLGDAAANFIWQTMITFQLAFYTDAFGITAAAAGTLFLVVRVFDAGFDPFMGVVADRTNTRWGKFRPWILWTAVPFGVIAVLAFTTPNLSPSGKLGYAYVTYILLMMVYSANNLPYSALSGVMTGDAVERTSLSSYRMLFAMLAQFVVQVLALPMVARFGHGNDALGYKVTIGIFSALAVVFFIITFATTRERVRPDPRQKTSIRQDFADLLGNGPWKTMFALTVILFITLALRGGVLVYFFKYYVKREDAFSWFNGIGTAATIIGLLLSKPIAARIGKRRLFLYGLIGTVVFTAAFILLPANNLPAHHHHAGAAAVRLRIHDPAALGDDGRRRRFLGVEKSSARHGGGLLGDHLRPQGGTRNRRGDPRLLALHIWLRPERRTDRARAARHPDDGEHLSGHRFRVVCGLSRVLRHRQDDRARDVGRAHRTTRHLRDPAAHRAMSHRHLSAALAASLCLAACSRATSPASPSATGAAQGQGLKDKFRSAFLVGAALAPKQFEEQDVANAALVKREFNAISPENVLKWVIVHPQPNQYDFAPADKYVAFGERNGMFIVGHTLVWHSQVPAWVFQDAQGQPLTRDALLARMKEHIQTVVGRYKGRIKGWDVVNEALNEDGSLRETPWMKIIGPDYIRRRSSTRTRRIPRQSSTTTTTTWTTPPSATVPFASSSHCSIRGSRSMPSARRSI